MNHFVLNRPSLLNYKQESNFAQMTQFLGASGRKTEHLIQHRLLQFCFTVNRLKVGQTTRKMFACSVLHITPRNCKTPRKTCHDSLRNSVREPQKHRELDSKLRRKTAFVHFGTDTDDAPRTQRVIGAELVSAHNISGVNTHQKI